jgi:uncharacterized membrane protein
MISELKTFLIAMSPIVELRGAIPLAYGVYKMSIWSAYFFSVAGNIVPLVGIVILAKPISQWLSDRFNFFKKFFDWLFLKITKKMNKLGILGKDLIVVVLTAIPIPLVGGWTGALASFMLEIPAKRGIILVSLGAMISGVIVSLLTLGIINIIKL